MPVAADTSPRGMADSAEVSPQRSLRQADFKSRGLRERFQERRRNDYLKRQRQARRDLTEHARRLAEAAVATEDFNDDDQFGDSGQVEECRMESEKNDEEEDGDGAADAMETQGGEHRQGRHGRKRSSQQQRQAQDERIEYSHQLMMPEWLLDVPADLRPNWLVFPRPEGKRCLVISSKDKTVSRLRSGALHKRFQSALPGGSRARGSGDYCILDCIFHEPEQTFYVLDLMCWKGYSLYDCDAEFRQFWLHTKLAETSVAAVSYANHFRFVPLPCFTCDPAGLDAAYRSQYSFIKDGLLLNNKRAHYALDLTPLALLWKDALCCRYFNQSSAPTPGPSQMAVEDGTGAAVSGVGGAAASGQIVVLEVSQDWHLCTSDDPPVVLGVLPAEFLAGPGKHVKPGHLLRFTISAAAIVADPTTSTGVAAVQDLRFLSRMPPHKSKDRCLADSWSKIMFQQRAQTDPLRYEELAEQAANTDAPAQDMDEEGVNHEDGTATGTGT